MDRDAHLYTPKQISIHSLRMEGDLATQLKEEKEQRFQSTPSVWRETSLQSAPDSTRNYFNPLPPYGGRRFSQIYTVCVHYFNPLPPYGGRPGAYGRSYRRRNISIHSLRMEGDLLAHIACHNCVNISIHSLRMEGDSIILCQYSKRKNFNPLPPYGGRQREGAADTAA